MSCLSTVRLLQVTRATDQGQKISFHKLTFKLRLNLLQTRSMKLMPVVLPMSPRSFAFGLVPRSAEFLHHAEALFAKLLHSQVQLMNVN